MLIGKHDISGGDRVRFLDAYGKIRMGTANALLLFPTHVVLDMGGGKPQVVLPDRIIAVKRSGA